MGLVRPGRAISIHSIRWRASGRAISAFDLTGWTLLCEARRALVRHDADEKARLPGGGLIWGAI